MNYATPYRIFGAERASIGNDKVTRGSLLNHGTDASPYDTLNNYRISFKQVKRSSLGYNENVVSTKEPRFKAPNGGTKMTNRGWKCLNRSSISQDCISRNIGREKNMSESMTGGRHLKYCQVQKMLRALDYYLGSFKL